MGAQHQGVYGLPRCLGDNVKLCDYVRLLLNHGVYLKLVYLKTGLHQVDIKKWFVNRWIQKFVTPAEYWHDPLDEESYKESSVFLADINNEKVIFNVFQLMSFIIAIFLYVFTFRMLTKLTKPICSSLKTLWWSDLITTLLYSLLLLNGLVFIMKTMYLQHTLFVNLNYIWRWIIFYYYLLVCVNWIYSFNIFRIGWVWKPWMN